MRPQPDSKTADLTFAISKRITVEYLAKPSRMTEEELKAQRKKLGYQ